MDISNKTLAVLVIIAIIVALVGIFMGRVRIVTVGKPTEIGLVNVTVESNIDITVYGGVNFTEPLTPGGSTRSSHLGGTICSEALGLCNMTVGSVGTTLTRIDYVSDVNLFFKRPNGEDNPNRQEENDLFNASVMGGGGSGGASFTACTDMTPWNGGAAPVKEDYQNVNIDNVDPIVLDTIADDCLTNEGFTMFIQIRVPIFETTGLRTSVLTFSGVDSS